MASVANARFAASYSRLRCRCATAGKAAQGAALPGLVQPLCSPLPLAPRPSSAMRQRQPRALEKCVVSHAILAACPPQGYILISRFRREPVASVPSDSAGVSSSSTQPPGPRRLHVTRDAPAIDDDSPRSDVGSQRMLADAVGDGGRRGETTTQRNQIRRCPTEVDPRLSVCRLLRGTAPRHLQRRRASNLVGNVSPNGWATSVEATLDATFPSDGLGGWVMATAVPELMSLTARTLPSSITKWQTSVPAPWRMASRCGQGFLVAFS